MRNWHSLFDLLKLPIQLVFVGVIMLGFGNLITNPLFGVANIVDSEIIVMIAEIINRIGQFLVVNFPILFLIRITTRKGGNAASIASSITGYVAFLVATIYFAKKDLPSNTYSSILGINVSNSTLPSLINTTNAPLQTGLLGVALVAIITLWSFHNSKSRNEYSVFPVISKEVACFLKTVFLSIICGVAVSFVWPYFISFVQRLNHFIEVDVSNPINLGLYGMADRIFSVLNLSSLIRQPFWYGNGGGTWMTISGLSVAGDVNIWSSQLMANSITGMTGHFITPYFILNIFAIPGMIWAMFSVYSEKEARRKIRVFCIFLTIVSIFTGILLPLELMLLFLAPILFFMHIAATGIFFIICQALKAYLGYYANNAYITTAMPGTLLEYVNYMRYPSLSRAILIVAILGVVAFFAYFFMTRLYFNHLGLDLFKTGYKEELIKNLIKGTGGIENIKSVEATISDLSLTVYDASKFDVARIKKLGALRIYENKAGYMISLGASSKMIKESIEQEMRDTLRGA